MTTAARWRLLLGAVLGLTLPVSAQAQSFTWQGAAQARLESNSNPTLQQDAGGTLVSRTVSGSLSAQRSTEAAVTQGEAELTLTPNDRGSSTAALGRLSLRHRLSAPRDTWSGNLAYRRDRALDAAATATATSTPTAADVAVGRTDRMVGEASLSWSHALSERLSSEFDVSHSRTEYRAAAAGSDFDLSSASTGLRHAWRETTSLAATLSATEQRPLGASPSAPRARIDSLRFSVTEQVSEVGTAGVSVASSSTTRGYALTTLVCPLPVQFCQGGIVRYVLASTPVRTRNRDLQYSANANWRWDETTAMAARVARALTPGALGVTREDVFSLSASRSFSETTSAGLAFDLSRSLQAPGGGDSTSIAVGASSTLRSLSVFASHRLGEQLTLSTQLQSRHYARPSPQVGATATVFSISLQYQGATVLGWR